MTRKQEIIEAAREYTDGWKEFKGCECLTRWAYITDLLPKGKINYDR